MGILDNVNDNLVSVVNDPAVESEITLLAIESECTPEEYADIVNNLAAEMHIYNVIDDAEVALEAVQKIIIKDAKTAAFNKVQARTAIRLAQAAGDALYKDYKKFRDKMIEKRDAIFAKYASKAKSETRTILMNAKRKASSMQSGNAISKKIDSAINKAKL